MPSNTYALVAIVVLWFCSAVAALWWFEYRHWGSYSEQLITFDSQPILDLYPILKKDALNRPLVVHFKDDDCPCERYRAAHVKQIAPILASTEQVVLSRDSSVLQGLTIPATPAVAVWSSSGKLAYFGPYSSGMSCGEGFDFIDMVLSKLARQENPQWINNQGFGCFCPW